MDYKNAEGYADPTAYEALTAVAKSEKPYKPLVYIASPYSGDIETNGRRAQGYCRFAVTKNRIPIAPHLHYPQFMDDSDKEQRELGLLFALVLLGKCDELWINVKRFVMKSRILKPVETQALRQENFA
jgi:hypothetical protein